MFDGFDWKSPDYIPVFRHRLIALSRIRSEPQSLNFLKAYYRENPWDFINDWGMTYEPRNVEIGLPSNVPFVLFPKQIEWCKWLFDHWKKRKPGLTEKSRDGGLTWLTVGMSCALCLFYEGMSIGFGSRKEEYVDKKDAPKAFFVRCRQFMEAVPVELRGGWDVRIHAPDKRMIFPETGSFIGGEIGDSIGRGDRTGIYFVDEAAHLEHPDQADFALSQTTNCRMDISSVNGMNAFAQKRHSGKVDVFTFLWRDDPRKDDIWYQKQCDELDPVVVAQEIDINYQASTEGVLIPSAWIQAAVDADKKLGFEATGAHRAALDVAEGVEGGDSNAFCGTHGVKIECLEEWGWSGKEDDIYATTIRAMGLCDKWGYDEFSYDADGLGAGVKGDARVISEERKKDGRRNITVTPFRGSGEVIDPEKEQVKGRKNKDFFANLKAQAWWSLRRRFQLTYRFVVQKRSCSYDDIIVIPSGLKKLTKLLLELAQPTYTQNNAGKLLVDKKPEGTRSPNLADAVMIAFAPKKARIIIPGQVQVKARFARRRVF